MRANLIYNPTSGGASQVTPEALLEALASAGYEPIYQATHSEEDLDALLPGIQGVVVAVGGDGTVRAAATRLIGCGVPLAIVPAGTSNNIGRTFGLGGSPVEIIAGLKDPVRRPFDIGTVASPWGVDYFLESFGYGLYADLLYFYEPEKGKSLLRSISALARTLAAERSHTCRVALDGVDISGDYLLLEALNTTALGPRVKLAPEADPGDGVLEIVRIQESNRDSLLTYLNGLLSETLEELPSVEVSRGRRLELQCEAAFPFHADAEVLPRRAGPGAGSVLAPGEHEEFPRTEGTVVVEVLPQALEIWLPQPVEARVPGRPVESHISGAGLPTPPPFSGPAL